MPPSPDCRHAPPAVLSPHPRCPGQDRITLRRFRSTPVGRMPSEELHPGLDPALRPAVRSAFYGGVDQDIADAAIALLGCESPTAMATQPITLTAQRWGSIPRTYVLCTRDNTIPVALQRLFVTQADHACPQNRTHVVRLESAHSPFLSMPDRLAEVIAGLVRPLATISSLSLSPSPSPSPSS
ncbi:alpha/beta fold hydrolase [Streptomyces sp. 2A115]|uniref:alpha/beta fold hydrolase n=1 Tax=Streptomyces sp. 2A115 TaxID=3457439 RepID=UPI003FD23AF9